MTDYRAVMTLLIRQRSEGVRKFVCEALIQKEFH
ncbi:hypothetical protein CAURIS_06005 [Corynebacterium auris]|nr:hypothetical protein CAURIS_06005 [Corynebacterium auris]